MSDLERFPSLNALGEQLEGLAARDASRGRIGDAAGGGQVMSDLEHFPSLKAFGERLDELANRDARRARQSGLPRVAWGTGLRRLVPASRYVAALGAVLALIAGIYTVPPTRAAVEDLYESTLAHWFSREGTEAPGRPAGLDEDLPNWLALEQGLHGEGDARVLAEANGEKLVALRQGEKITLGVADFSQTSSVNDLRDELAGEKIRLLAPGRFAANGRHDLRAIFGLVSASVRRIQLNYADGSSPDFEDHLNGAFGFTIQANRRASSLTGYDETGALIARKIFMDERDARSPNDVVGDFRYCPATGCLPWIK